MIFRRISRGRPLTTTLLAGGMLVAIAVFGWGVALGDVAKALWLSFVWLALTIIPAAIFVLLIVLFRRLKNKSGG